MSTSPIVAVTGVSGYLGGHVAAELIRRGYHVRGTVRSFNDTTKVGHLRQDFPQMELFEADLLKPGSFHAAFQGCKYIFHTASPFFLNPKDAVKELIEPAVDGTINVLEEALKVPTVERVVLTSSVAATRRWDLPEGHILTEADWNETASPTNMPYPYSKVAAEKKAWEIINNHNVSEEGKKHPVSLVTILPSFIIGPPYGARVDGTSIQTIIGMLNETQEVVSPIKLCYIDVRVVAQAHVEAAERKAASGRYIVSSREQRDNLEYVEIFKKHYPNKKYPTQHDIKGKNSVHGTDPSKAEKELGVVLIPLEKSLSDMVDKLVRMGLVKP